MLSNNDLVFNYLKFIATLFFFFALPIMAMGDPLENSKEEIQKHHRLLKEILGRAYRDLNGVFQRNRLAPTANQPAGWGVKFD